MPRRKQPKGPDGRFIPAPTITIDHDDTLGDLTPLPHFAGPSWDGHTPGQVHREQRATQVAICLDHLETWAASAPMDAEPPEVLIREATVILRAGPAATPLELTRGRIA